MSAPVVGQEVVIRDRFGSGYSFGYTISKITPTGQIAVTDGQRVRRFKRRYSEYRELGSEGHRYAASLYFDVEDKRQEVARQLAGRDAAMAINAVVARVGPSACRASFDEAIAELEVKLAAARELVKLVEDAPPTESKQP